MGVVQPRVEEAGGGKEGFSPCGLRGSLALPAPGLWTRGLWNYGRPWGCVMTRAPQTMRWFPRLGQSLQRPHRAMVTVLPAPGARGAWGDVHTYRSEFTCVYCKHQHHNLKLR